MKRNFKELMLIFFVFFTFLVSAQDVPVSPTLIGEGVYLGLSEPLRDLPSITAVEFRKMQLEGDKERNMELQSRSYPFSEMAMPNGPDPAWQKEMGKTGSSKAPIVTFDGQTSPYYPPDANGATGINHFMQTINTVYAIYSKTGSLLAGPTDLNLIFGSVPGATCNDGDPIVLYDEQADRWFIAEFSVCGSNDYMLIAVSQTNDPTGSWHRYSFDVADMPDYEKFGIWQDGYYMATNNDAGKDIYVFQRSQMLIGGTAQMVGFVNPYRPTTIDGFVCVPPVDNDGAFAPAGSPGLFVAFNDDAIGGGSDQLWIYELSVNWTSPASSSFARTQQLSVTPFDSNFGNNWDNIKQPGTTRELDAIPMVVMNAPQYRNFGSYQTMVLCHTVDVDNTDHAGIRWYELRKTGTTWSVRQQGTYAPDANSRWMGSIRLNGFGEIGLGYSIASSSVYPGIRYCGQSSTAYASGSGVLDVSEQTITTGTYSQTAYNRWGDYSSICIDPTNDMTFWYTNQYVGSSGANKTRIASFQIGTASSAPDLTVLTPAASPATILSGQTTTASCTVKNQGTASAGASVLKYYLSANTTFDVTDALLGSTTVATLAAGASATASSVVTIPASTTAGTWYILFYADADLAVNESNETNNVGNVQITVTSTASQPDLTVLTPAASPATILSGQTTTASCTVKNQGTASAGASVLKYYLSANTTFDVTDALLGSTTVATVAAGASATASSLVTIPASTTAGTWYILFYADADLAVNESNETNNVGNVQITVQSSLQGCNSTSQYPPNTLTPTTSWKYQNYIWAGEYTAFTVTSGTQYVWSLCSSDGANAPYNSELTLRNKANDAFIAYSNDDCGDDARITWNATFTGTVKVITSVNNCGVNNVDTKMAYKMISGNLPDLIVTGQAANPTNITPSQTTNVSCTVKNQGTASAGTSVLKYYLSANSTFETTDVLLGSGNVATLAAGATATANSIVTIPASTTSGTWYILFYADANLAVTETSETNNVGFVQISVQSTSQGCNSTSQYPSNTLTPTTTWKYQNYIWAGEYTAFAVINGTQYVWSLCADDGAFSNYDSELTLRNKATDAFIAYSDDECGYNAKITWTATFTGTVKLVTSEYSCESNYEDTKLAYKKLAKGKIEETSETEAVFSVYPNPSTSITFIQSTIDFTEVNEILLFDMNGRLIRTISFKEKFDNSIQVDVSLLNSGIYYFKLVGDKFTKELNLVVSH